MKRHASNNSIFGLLHYHYSTDEAALILQYHAPDVRLLTLRDIAEAIADATKTGTVLYEDASHS
jgi:hypothetical protein